MRKSLRYLTAALCLGGITLLAQSKDPGSRARNDVPVTAVAGESWINHLHRTFGDTSMGKTGRLGPPAPQPGDPSGGWHLTLASGSANQTVTLHGSDLYRLNCQGCHGADGLGAPPEINSVINPVRATSVAMVMERMKKMGMEMPASDAAQLVRQSNAALLQRLHTGGQDMPPFPHLSENEIAALIGYLKQLAGVPGAQREQIAVRESSLRVGEHIVKSTCHICHSAAGSNPTPQAMEDGVIPPLETLTSRTDEAQFVRKVTQGAPVVMGTPPVLHRGRMPVFYYFSEDEAADVYLYLTLYPPSQTANTDTTMAALQQDQGGGGNPPAPFNRLTSVSPQDAPAETKAESGSDTGLERIALMGVIGVTVFLMLGAGLFFTLHEFKRLAAESAGRERASRTNRLSSRTEHASGHPTGLAVKTTM